MQLQAYKGYFERGNFYVAGEVMHIPERCQITLVFEGQGIQGETKIGAEDQRNRLMLEEVFADWDGSDYDGYDWGDMDKPAGRELL